MLLDHLDKPDEGGKIGGLKRIDCYDAYILRREVGNQRLKVANGSIVKDIALVPGSQLCLHNCWVERLGPDGIPVYPRVQNSSHASSLSVRSDSIGTFST
jgi:hypothetical protein